MKINVSNIVPQSPRQIPAVNATVTETISDISAQPAQESEAVVSTVPVVPAAPKQSWLKRVGHFLGSILKFVANEEPKVAAIAKPALEAAFPQFTTLIEAGDALASKITQEILLQETLATAVGQATTGQAKLDAVLARVGPEVDLWAKSAFPGAKTLSDPTKKGLINAFVAAANEVEADLMPPVPAT